MSSNVPFPVEVAAPLWPAGPGARAIRSCRALLNVAHVWFLSRALGKKFMVKRIHDYQMCLPIDAKGIKGLPEALVRYGSHEADQVYIVRRELREGDVVADVGANMGYYALLEAGLVGRSGHVYAIEPATDNLALLQDNIKRNGKADTIETFHLGISDRVESGRLYLSALRNCHAFLETRPHPRPEVAGAPEVEMVPMADLSTFAADKRPINLVRMDVEGYEVKVLRGMRPYIEHARHEMKILFEVHRSRYDDGEFDMRRELTHLFNCGFAAKTIVAKPLIDGKPWGRTAFTDRGYIPDFVMSAEGAERAFFTGVSPADVIDYVCSVGCVRALLLWRPAVT